jgi:DNA-binding HxlR family transcriptional regulator
MASRYGQYCPLSFAAEILGERWNILVVMQIIENVRRYSDLQRALPKIPPSTLSARLRALEAAELIVRKRNRSGDVEYRPTPAAQALEPILTDLAKWGQAWGRDMEIEDLDPEFLAWSMHTRMDVEQMPTGRVVVEFEFTGVPDRMYKRFWILKNKKSLEVCIKHPGHEVDLRVMSDIRVFVEAWRGIRSMKAELRNRRIRLVGAPALRRDFPRWMLLSIAAPIERQRRGRERTRSRRARTPGGDA